MIFEREDIVRPVTIIEKNPTVVCEESWDEVSIYNLVTLKYFYLPLHNMHDESTISLC